MNIYYVYVFLDPRKSGEFKYGEYFFDFEPFYVGKGKNDRINQHFKPHELNNNCLKTTKIKSIMNESHEVIKLKLYENLSEDESIKIESDLIKLIGRFDEGTGILMNMTSGGDGVSGYIASDELRSIRSINSKGENNSFFGKKHKPESFSFISRKVAKIDKNSDEILEEYISIAEASRKNYKCQDNHIRACCKGRRKLCGGFKWRYLEDEKVVRNWKPNYKKI